MIKTLAWRWTADAWCPRRAVVVPDLVKYNTRFQRHTPEALESLADLPFHMPGKVLRHEHAVPRSLLALQALETSRSVEEVERLLLRYCIAVLVTTDQDGMLRDAGLQDAMPREWQWGDDPLARYHQVGIKVVDPLWLSAALRNAPGQPATTLRVAVSTLDIRK